MFEHDDSLYHIIYLGISCSSFNLCTIEKVLAVVYNFCKCVLIKSLLFISPINI